MRFRPFTVDAKPVLAPMSRLLTSSRLLATFLLVASLLVDPAGGAELCVETTQELTEALQTAQSNGEDDIIKIRVSSEFTYVPTGDGFAYHEAESDYGRSLTILGGFAASSLCRFAQQVTQDPFDTILSGAQALPLLRLEIGPESSVHVENLTFFRGAVGATGSCGGGLRVTLLPEFAGQSFAGRVSVVRNWFLGNQAWSGGGLCVRGSKDVRVINNVFEGNVAQVFGGAMFLWDEDFEEIESCGAIRLSNNTIVSNTATQGEVGGLFVGGGDYALLANNLLWDNTGLDLRLGLESQIVDYPVPEAILLHNNYETIAHTVVPIYEGGRMQVAPIFEGGVLLKQGSLLLDAGAPDVPLTALDVYGQPRVSGPGVDIGAAETPRGRRGGRPRR